MRSRRGVLALALAAFAGAAWPQAAAPYPARPIRLVIGFAPGGAADYVARAMSDAFAKALGQSVLVDNKPGNGSSIAADLVAKSPADGYTLLIASPSSISVNPALNPKLTYSLADLPQASSGRLRAIAVSTRERSPLVPELPGMREAGLPEYNLEFWYGMFAPAATPPAVLRKIYDATAAAMLDPTVKAALAREGTEVSLSASPEKFAEFLVEDGKFWVNLVKNAKVTVE